MVYIILLLGIVVSSSAAILIKLCSAHPFVIAAYRMVIAATVMMPLAIRHHRAATKELFRSQRLPVLASGLLLAAHFTSWISSLSHTSVASSAFLVTTNPIFVAIGGWIFLKERLKSRLAIGTVVALAGAFWISYGDVNVESNALLGDVLAICGAIGMSGHLLIGRQLRQHIALTPYIATVYSIAAVTLVAIAFASGQSLTGHTVTNYALFLALAAGPQLVGHTSFNFALKRISPSVLVLLLLLEPISSSALALDILSETPSTATFAGGGIILTGIVFALARHSK